MSYEVMAVRNGEWKDEHGRPHMGQGDVAMQWYQHLESSPRSKWGLYDETILIATKRPGVWEPHAVEEMTWYDSNKSFLSTYNISYGKVSFVRKF